MDRGIGIGVGGVGMFSFVHLVGLMTDGMEYGDEGVAAWWYRWTFALALLPDSRSLFLA